MISDVFLNTAWGEKREQNSETGTAMQVLRIKGTCLTHKCIDPSGDAELQKESAKIAGSMTAGRWLWGIKQGTFCWNIAVLSDGLVFLVIF